MNNKALIKATTCLLLLSTAVMLALLWAAQSEDSALASKVRRVIGIPALEPSVTEDILKLPTTESIAEPPPAMPPVEVIVEPDPITPIAYAQVVDTPRLWPSSLRLKYSKQISIRFNGKVHGYMEFTPDSVLQVETLSARSGITGTVNGHYLSISVHETDFEPWFQSTYAERYALQPIPELDSGNTRSGDSAITPESEKEFWREMRIWCHLNYASLNLKIEADGLVFKWLPQEQSPIDFQAEAREIARVYLLKRSALGGHENYAACEIRHPSTDELLGSGAIFIPQL